MRFGVARPFAAPIAAITARTVAVAATAAAPVPATVPAVATLTARLVLARRAGVLELLAGFLVDHLHAQADLAAVVEELAEAEAAALVPVPDALRIGAGRASQAAENVGALTKCIP